MCCKGASNDQQMLNASQLLEKLAMVLPKDLLFLLYGDAGYTPRENLLVSPYKRYTELTEEQKVHCGTLSAVWHLADMSIGVQHWYE
jgi:hypothetical protein